MKNQLLQKLKYLFWDLVAACSAYTILYVYRKVKIESDKFGEVSLDFSENYYLGLLLIGLFWLSIYSITGFYRDIYRRSRLKEFIYTFNSSLLGSIVILFLLILDDFVSDYTDYYSAYFVYFAAHFLTTVFFRILLSTRTSMRIKKGSIRFNTLIVGSNEKAAGLISELEDLNYYNGTHIVGFASVKNNIEFLLNKNLKHLGSYLNIAKMIEEHQIEEVIIAIESSEHEKLEEIINLLEEFDVLVRMIPDTYDIISGKVKLESLSAPLVEIKHELMPPWQKFTKRLFDIVASLLLLSIVSPIFLFSMLMVRLSSSGPIFFRQSRLGLHGKEFLMIKFRSMVKDAEKDGPQLSSENDSRITKWGRVMRKYRLDELPQFINVLLGHMSIVGPRPERRYYAELIKAKAPHYKYVHKVKPGITSWGMVKFGYAENIDEMVERLKYEIIYIENMNLFNDVKVLIYTILIVLQGRGK
jgi:exopolysaccharide biosynthesis polyprenyl glycosylphosphotransferase